MKFVKLVAEHHLTAAAITAVSKVVKRDLAKTKAYDQFEQEV